MVCLVDHYTHYWPLYSAVWAQHPATLCLTVCLNNINLALQTSKRHLNTFSSFPLTFTLSTLEDSCKTRYTTNPSC